MSDELEINVVDNPQRRRWEGLVDGEVAGYAEYETYPDVIAFTHTVVQPKFEGKGVAGAIVRTALDAVRDQGTHQVDPQCSYVKGWIAKHPDYLPLVYGDARPAAD